LAVLVGFIGGCFFGALLFMVGLGLLMIPILGWILGPLAMLFGVVAPIALPMALAGEWNGTCPVCGSQLAIHKNGKCPTCKQWIVRRGDRFIAAQTMVSRAR
jgi:hypothetical protein